MAKKNDDLDMKAFKETREYCNDLRMAHTARKQMQDEMEKMYLMDWAEKDRIERQDKAMKVTISPDARNMLLGSIRLFISTTPQFNVPYEVNEGDAKDQSEKLEKAAGIMWQAAGRVAGTPPHFDMILSGMLWGEMHAGITKTSDLVEHLSGSDNKAAKNRAEKVARRAPFIIDVWDPRDGYPVYDSLGLREYHRQSKMTTGEVLDRYGKHAEGILDGSKRLEEQTLNMFWDYKQQVVWVEGKDTPILQEEHGLPSIPMGCTIAEGSRMFSKPEYQRQPFLYGLWKSGLWNRQNLTLSVLYYLIFTIGANPMMVYKSNEAGKKLELDWDVPGGVAKIEKDESLDPMNKNVIDPSLLMGLDIANQKTEESTIFKQAMGQPVKGAHISFSLVSLLSQSGRLPLVEPQRKLGWGLGNIVEIMFERLKHDGKKAKAKYEGELVELEAKDIPDDLEVDVKLDVALPQDKLQMATIVDLITRGPDPVVSKRFARENYLNIQDPKEMQKEIWKEHAGDMFFGKFMEDQMQASVQGELGQQGMPGGGQGMGAGPGMPGGGGGAGTNEMDIKQIVEGIRSGQINPASLPPQIQQAIAPILEGLSGGGGLENVFKNAGGQLPTGPVNNPGGEV